MAKIFNIISGCRIEKIGEFKMPQASHHEIEITKLPPENRFKALVYCKGCKWQSHVMKEENAEQVGAQHQAAWGYEPKPAQVPTEEIK